MKLSVNIKGFVSIPTPSKKYWLVPHDKMRYNYDDEKSGGWRFNPKINGPTRHSASIAAQPEVYRLDPEDGFILPEPFKDLICNINPEFDRDKALSVLNPALAFCNGEYGRFDQTRVMGGWIVSGKIDNDKLWINTVRINDPVPTAQQVLNDKSLWNWCVSVRPDGFINYFHRRASDGTMKRIRMIIFSQNPIYIPLNELYPLPDGFFPETHWMPNPV